MGRTRDYYHDLRRKYKPDKIELAIIAESPPVSGLYFYDASGRYTEPLFKALMLQLRAYPCTKAEGLEKFKQRGWILVDATYRPVNSPNIPDRDQVILGDYPLLKTDLDTLMPDRTTPLILIKANVCRMLEPELVRDGFNVLNSRRLVYFPSNGRQPDFHAQFGNILASAGIKDPDARLKAGHDDE